MRTGLMATRAAATTPASRPTRVRVAAYTTGPVATPAIAEVARGRPDSLQLAARRLRLGLLGRLDHEVLHRDRRREAGLVALLGELRDLALDLDPAVRGERRGILALADLALDVIKVVGLVGPLLGLRVLVGAVDVHGEGPAPRLVRVLRQRAADELAVHVVRHLVGLALVRLARGAGGLAGADERHHGQDGQQSKLLHWSSMVRER